MLNSLRSFRKSLRYATQGLWKASKVQTHLTEEEKWQLATLAERKGGVVVEVGSYVGASACFIAAGLSRSTNARNAKLYCVDTWKNDAMTEGARDTFSDFMTNTQKFSHLIQTMRGRSSEVASQFHQDIDILFLDGDHSYEAVKADWYAWSPFLKENSIAIFHDFGWATGVKTVIEEEVKKVAREEHIMPNMYWAVMEGSKQQSCQC
ncbi:hypothetical protein Q31b_26240 [Novipirellula aureliae]|uniref:Class I SAM-dependent methyltransferase n=1 Tax=Novipirellula aureliae TaxID=2527966 RepID=A0A5C6DXP8_9BACT|nr:class I SAM-dependent methyltransferase [Novipirellula aureliae]TWU41185.1 hypothetical protein Q31b_26240 [Novipirellula aureliae]